MKAHHVRHLIYRILSYLVAVPHQAHHFPRPQAPETLFLVLFRVVPRHVARLGLDLESNIRGGGLLSGSPLCSEQQERLGICHSVQ